MKRTERLVTAGFLVVLASASVSVSRADEQAQFCKFQSFAVDEGATRTGDLYLLANSADIEGRLEGDMLGLVQSLLINGEVTGDVFAAANSVEINGRVGDAVRAFSQSVTVKGQIDGDLLVFAQNLVLNRSARIAGNLYFFGQAAALNGTIEGDVRAAGGEVSIAGTIGRSAKFKVDTIRIDPQARIAGDLDYSARKPIELAQGVVGGRVDFEERKKKEDDAPRPWLTWSGALWWAWKVAAAALVGLVLVGLLRGATERLVAPIGQEALTGVLIGLGVFVVVPAAAFLALVLIVSLPLGVLALVLFAVALYLAKIPVAVWLGGRVLRLAGASDPAPALALLAGLVVLYLGFSLPYVGFLLWLVTAWLGFGAAILATRGYLQREQA